MTTIDYCIDTRKCCFRDIQSGRCMALRETYERDGQCPFAKRNIYTLPYNMIERKRKK